MSIVQESLKLKAPTAGYRARMWRAVVQVILVLLAGCAASEDSFELELEGEGRERVRARAEAGDANAMLEVARDLLTIPPGSSLGWGSPDREARVEARAWLERAAERSNARAMVCLATLHEMGWASGTGEPGKWGQIHTDDPAELAARLRNAGEWLRRAAELGDLEGMRRYAEHLVGGRRAYGSPPVGEAEEAEGLTWFRRAAAGGDEEARWLLLGVIGARPAVREACDDALAPTGPRSFETAWPASSGFLELPPVVPPPVLDSEDAGTRATARLHEGRLDEATALALEVLKARPFDPRAACVLAACDLRRAVAGERVNAARVELAEALLRGALEVTPDAPELHAAMAVVEAWRTVIARSDTWACLAVRSAVVAAYLTGEESALATHVRDWLVARGFPPGERFWPDEQAWTPAAEVGRMLGRRAPSIRTHEARERELDEALGHAPDDRWLLLDRAHVRRARGDLAGADVDLARALEHAPASERAALHRERAVVRHAAGDLDGAIAAIGSAASFGGDDGKATFHRGLLRWQRGEPTAAFVDLEAADRDAWVPALGGGRERRWPTVLGYEARRSGAPSVARLWVGLCTRAELAARLDAADFGWGRADARCHLGMHAERDGDLDAARTSYRAALAEPDRDPVVGLWARLRLRALER